MGDLDLLECERRNSHAATRRPMAVRSGFRGLEHSFTPPRRQGPVRPVVLPRQHHWR